MAETPPAHDEPLETDAPKARRLAEMAMDYLHHDADQDTYERHVSTLTRKFSRLTRGPSDPAPQPVGRRQAHWVRQQYGATVATINETPDGALEIISLGSGKFRLTVHQRIGEADRFEDCSIDLEEKHFEALGAVPSSLRALANGGE